ncbi:hypothetical protein X777_03256 [Ooceraea biroi]|uniref:THAP-type domain-containing protein n=1 Tax=Ooceraea biroi TaxID=2015173 RepID=A0A026WKT0_OOCBI|nr:hypothetical protein X777_03256 [Ooceraea biroi]
MPAFPFKNTNIINYWIAATGRDNWIPYSDARISSVHFTHNDYYNINSNPQKRYLKPDAIPTQNMIKITIFSKKRRLIGQLTF